MMTATAMKICDLQPDHVTIHQLMGLFQLDLVFGIVAHMDGAL